MLLKKILNSIDFITVTNFFNENSKNIIEIEKIAYNSKKCTKNAIFIAIKGANFDGNQYISDAIENGATVIVSESIEIATVEKNIVYIVVENARKALAQIAQVFYDFPAKKLKIIGITGTNGKTTTTFLVKSILDFAQKKNAIIGTTGIFIGDKKIEATHTTPESLELAELFCEMIAAEIEYVIMEVSSHSLALDRVYGLDFLVAAFTNLSHDHLDFHSSFDEYAKAKKILFDNLTVDSIAIINQDDRYSQLMISNSKAKKRFFSGIDKNMNYFFDEIEIRNGNTDFSLHYESQKLTIRTLLTAYFNVQNAVLAIAICAELGIDFVAIAAGIAASRGASGRMELVKVCSGATAFVDYAHTPDALEKALLACKSLQKVAKNRNNFDANHDKTFKDDYCNKIEQNSSENNSYSNKKQTYSNEINENIIQNKPKINEKSKLICVFGCGGDRDKTKRALMGTIAEKYADIVIITDDNPRTEPSKAIICDIISEVFHKNRFDKNRIKVINDRSSAIEFAVLQSSAHDIILVAGKGHEDYQVIGKEKQHFSDVEKLISIKK